MPVSPESVIKDLKEQKFAPVYFLQGEEPYYIDLICDLIENTALPESERSFNQVIMYGKDVDMGVVLNNARRFPMMAQRQVVIVKEAQELADLNKEEGQRLLGNYIQTPLPSTVLVFAHKHKNIDGRKPLAKTLDKMAVFVDSPKIRDYKLPDWISGYFREKGLTAKPSTLQLLAENIGADLSRLANEIDKLSINLRGKQTEITPELVQEYVGISKDYNIFELQKALVERNVLKANKIIQYFEADPKSNPLVLNVAALFGFFTKVLLVHAATDKSEKALAALLKVNPFFVKDYLAATRTFPLPKTIQIIGFLRQADIRSKGIDSGNATEGEIMKELVFKILH